MLLACKPSSFTLTDHPRLFATQPTQQAHIDDVSAPLFFVNRGLLQRMEQEWRDLFVGAGFRLSRIVPTKSPFSVIEADVA